MIFHRPLPLRLGEARAFSLPKLRTGSTKLTSFTSGGAAQGKWVASYDEGIGRQAIGHPTHVRERDRFGCVNKTHTKNVTGHYVI